MLEKRSLFMCKATTFRVVWGRGWLLFGSVWRFLVSLAKCAMAKHEYKCEKRAQSTQKSTQNTRKKCAKSTRKIREKDTLAVGIVSRSSSAVATPTTPGFVFTAQLRIQIFFSISTLDRQMTLNTVITPNQWWKDPVTRPVPLNGIWDGTGRVFFKGIFEEKKPSYRKISKIY